MVNPDRLIYTANENAKNFGERIAWIDRKFNESVSFSDLYQETRIAVQCLKQEGLSKGQIVCLVLTRSGSFLPLLMACIELELILAPVKADKHELRSEIRILKPRLLLYAADSKLETDSFPKKTKVFSVREFLRYNNIKEDFKTEGLGRRDQPREDPCLLIKTSGTTGKSKYVELSEKNLAWDSHSLQNRYQCSQKDKFLCTLPWTHMNAIMMTGCLPMAAGAVVEYQNITRSQDPIQALLDAGTTVASLTPTLISFLIKRQKPGQNLNSLNFAFCGAAPLDEDLWRKGEEALSCNIYQGYGLTETTCWATSTPPGSNKTYNDVGIPLDCDIKIDTSHDIQLVTQTSSLINGAQKVGEIEIAGPIVMSGYRYPGGRRKSMLTSKGFFKTGDIGYIDDNGYLKIVGRTKEIIIRSAINIVPESIDSVARSHPDLLDSKTVGVSDDLLGEKVITACVLKPGRQVSVMEIRRYISARLSGQLLPNELVFVAQLPKTGVGKIAIGELRNIVSGEYARQIFEAINTWKFKRAQPLEPERILRTFQHNILNARPLSFVAYWGAGMKENASEVDREAIKRLGEFVRAAKVMPDLQVKLELILTDAHAALNGKPKNRVDKYLSEIERIGATFGFRSIRSSDLWGKAGITVNKITELGKSKTLKEVTQLLSLSSDVVNKLINSAKRHVEHNDPEEGLKRYLLACQVERETFAEEYKNSVFLTYNDPSMSFLTPPLPTIALSSYRSGTGEKPWFVDK